MKNISVRLQQFVAESLHPNSLVGQRLSAKEFDDWKQHLNKEIGLLTAKVFKYSFNCYESEGGYVKSVIAMITELSNTVNSYRVKLVPLWRSHPDAVEIKLGYNSLCIAFEADIDLLVKRYPKWSGQTSFTDHIAKQIKIELKSQLSEVKLRLHNVDNPLRHIVTDGISNLIQQRPLIRDNDTYLRKLMASILRTHFHNAEELNDHLITHDFNLPEYFLYCVNAWNEQLFELDGLADQKEMLLEAKSHLFDISLSKGLVFPSGNERLYNELNKFLSEKYELVKEKLKISRRLAADDSIRSRAKRMLINLSVAQFGLFIRIQLERGILANDHIGDLFAFYARHFYTPNTDFISPESLQKKSSVVEHATARKLKALLIDMLNWLNKNYNLSNYN